MIINIKATHTGLTPAISAYVEEKVAGLGKFIVTKDPESVLANVEIGLSTKHHQSGKIYYAEINLHIGGTHLRAVSEQEDLYAAIDDMKEEIAREIIAYKNKKRDMFRKGGAAVKNFLKGLGKSDNE